MSTPLTDQLRSYFDDVDRHQGAVDIDALRRRVEEGLITIELSPNNALPPNGPTTGRRWPILLGAAAVVVVVVGALVVSGGRDTQESPSTPPVANGLIAFSGDTGDGPSASDIYVVAPDGTGLRALTSTHQLAEEVPTWSPDGSHLAFVRRTTSLGPTSSLCTKACLVVVDPSTGVETFSVDLPRRATELQVAKSLAWSPDGRQIVVIQADCGVGGCGGSGAVVVDLATRAATRITPSSGFAEWSPDGRWLYLEQFGESMLLVPADVVGTGDLRDADDLAGARVLPAPEGTQFGYVSGWTPDGSALFVETGVVRPPDGSWKAGRGNVWIDVISIADGQRRTVIEDGFDADVSPDGSKIAYTRADAPGDIERGDPREIWVAAADGSNQRRVTISLTPPTWSPDSRLLLASDDEGWFTVLPDGTGRTEITPLMPANRDLICCPYNQPSWQPLP